MERGRVGEACQRARDLCYLFFFGPIPTATWIRDTAQRRNSKSWGLSKVGTCVGSGELTVTGLYVQHHDFKLTYTNCRKHSSPLSSAAWTRKTDHDPGWLWKIGYRSRDIIGLALTLHTSFLTAVRLKRYKTRFVYNSVILGKKNSRF